MVAENQEANLLSPVGTILRSKKKLRNEPFKLHRHEIMVTENQEGNLLSPVGTKHFLFVKDELI
jgi:hypothetical protein